MIWATGGNPLGKYHCYKENKLKLGITALCNYYFTWAIGSTVNNSDYISESELCSVCTRIYRNMYGEPEPLLRKENKGI